MHTRNPITEAILLSKSQEDIRNRLVDLSPIPTYYIDTELCYQYANKACEGWLELAQKDIIGKPFAEVMGAAAIEILKDKIQSALAGNALDFEAEVPYKKGIRYVQLKYIPDIDNDGIVGGLMVLVSDITEKREMEVELQKKAKELQDYFDNATVGLHWVDSNGIIVWANKAELQLLGYTEEEYIGHHIAEFHADRPIIDDILTRLSRNETLNQYEALLRCKDGTIRNVVINSNVLWEDGNFVHTRCFTLDVTEKRKAEQFLSKANAELEHKVKERTLELSRKNEELEQFTYAASHDLKEPIRKIHFFTERLRERLAEKLQDEDLRYFDRLETGAKRMGILIDDLLMYSHISRGVSHEEVVDLNKTLPMVLEDLELSIEEKDAKIIIDALPVIKGNRLQLQQLFENLIGNSLKYSKSDSTPVIKLSSTRIKGSDTALHLSEEEESKAYHLIEVRDNGIGFEQADAERIFNVFTRLHGMAEYKGTGVGLSIVRKVAENHNGYVWAESKPGEGTTFKILLPAV